MNSKYLCFGKDSTSTSLSMESFPDTKFYRILQTSIKKKLHKGTQFSYFFEEDHESRLYASSQYYIADKDWEFYE